ncbi:hypothetical protein, partial [Pandoraea sputorum]|uniref:hypothetical protein n=1 Tax=Pandoraea sputorum TaxID=93222 RepID=UPI0035573C68
RLCEPECGSHVRDCSADQGNRCADTILNGSAMTVVWAEQASVSLNAGVVPIHRLGAGLKLAALADISYRSG